MGLVGDKLELWEKQKMSNDMAELKAYREDEIKGLLVKLPCVIGNKVYRIKSYFTYYEFPKEEVVTGILCVKNVNNENSFIIQCKSGFRFSADRLDNTVFSSYEAAETKIKERMKK